MGFFSTLRNAQSRLLRPTSLSTLQSMFASCVGQLAVIVSGICAARILGVHDRGQLALFILIPLILTVTGALGVPIATTYYIARDTSNARGIVKAIRKIVVVQIITIAAVNLVTLIVIYNSAPNGLKWAAATTLILIPTKLAQDYGSGILQGQQRFRAFNVTRCLPSFAYALSILVVFAVGRGHLLAVTVCYSLSTATAGLATLFVALRGLPPGEVSERNPRPNDLIKFGIKALFGAIYPTETFQIDQAFVGLFLSRVALGTYVVGVSFTNLPRFIAQSVGLVAYPHVAAISDHREARKAVWRFFWLVFAMSIVICGSLELATPTLIPLFFGNAFRGSISVTQILLISSFIVSIRRVLSDGMRGAGYPALGTLAELSGLLILLPSLIILIPMGGLTGAAIAMPIAAAGGFIVLLLAVGLTRDRDTKGPTTKVHPETPTTASLGHSERPASLSHLSPARASSLVSTSI